MEQETLTRTRSGVRIFAYPQPAVHRFCLSLYVRAGILSEGPDETGVTHFLEHMFFRRLGGLSQPELYTRLQRMGADFNGYTYRDCVCFEIKAAPRYFDGCAALAAALLAPLEATPSDVTAERRRVQSEIREKDEFDSMEYLTRKAVWDGTPLTRPSTGTVKGVQKIRLPQLQAFQRAYFHPGNLFFYVTGRFTPENIEQLRQFAGAVPVPASGASPDGLAPVPPGFGRRNLDVRLRAGDDSLTDVMLSFDLLADRYTSAELNLFYDLLFGGETGRFKLQLSEKSGLLYDFDAYVERYRNIGTLMISYSVVRSRVYDSLALTCRTLRSVKEHVSADDLSLFLPQYLDNTDFLLDDPGELNWEMAYSSKLLGTGARSVGDLKAGYRSVSPARLMRMAREILTPQNLLVYIRGDRRHLRADRVQALLAGL